MPHDPPTGEELKVLERVMLSVHRLDELRFSKPNTTGMTIHSGHAVKGVRVNGWARLINVLDVRDDIRAFAKETAKAREQAEHADETAQLELARVERFVAGFAQCPECEGDCGYGSREHRWRPCKTCEGRGLVKA